MGRIRQFDESDVLQKAMHTFWENGYEKTSVRTLEKSMGINQFSIYSTFNSKEGLYQRVLQMYKQQLNESFLHKLKREDCTIDDVEAFLKSFAKQIASKKIPNGCLMVRSTFELHSYDKELKKIVLAFFDMMRISFTRALMNSVKDGLIPKNSKISESAEYLIGIAQSISIYSKIKSQKETANYIEFAMNKLKT